MNPILLAVLIVAGLALAAGLILAVASVALAVPRDEKAEALRALLPGANCGACGYSGCDGYAAAMASGEAKPGLCSPGGEEVAAATAALVGGAVSMEKKAARVRCGGCDEVADRRADYHGVPSCAAAAQFFGGDKLCAYGCLGYGDCAAVCEYGAISVENGLAVIDPERCKACGLCVGACPKSLIAVLPASQPVVVRCQSHAKGAEVRKACTKGCIGCMKCTKVCAYDAIHVTNFLAEIDGDKCVGCGACAEACPVGCIEQLCAANTVAAPVLSEEKVEKI